MTDYEKKQIDVNLYTKKGFFIWYRPVMVPYNKLYAQTIGAGYHVLPGWGMYERSVMLGFGWIGIPVDNSKDDDESIVKIAGEFNSYMHIGPYNKLGDAFKKIMKDFPKFNEFYTVYISDPRSVPEEKLETMILFR